MPQKNITVAFSALGSDKVKGIFTDLNKRANQFQGTYTAKLDADDKDFKAKLTADLKQAQELGKKTIRIPVTADAADWEKTHDEIMAQAEAMGLEDVKINVRIDGDKAILTLAAINTELEAVNHEADGTPSRFAAIGLAAGGAAGGVSAMGAAMGLAVAGLAAVAPALAVAAVGMAALALPVLGTLTATKNLTSSQEAFKKELTSVQAVFQKWSGTVGKPVLNALTDGLKLVAPLLADISPLITAAVPSLNMFIKDLGTSIKSGGIQQILAAMAQDIPLVLPALGNLIGGILGLVGALLKAVPLNTSLAFIGNLTGAVKVLTPTLATLTTILATLVTGALGAFVTAVSWLNKNMPEVIPILIATVVAIKALTIAQGVLNAVMDANPISLVIIALAALGVGIYEVVKHWQVLSAFFSSMWHNVIEPIIRLWVDAWLNLAGVIVNSAARAFGWVPGIGGKLKSAAAEFNTFRDNVNRALGGLQNKSIAVKVNFAPTPSGTDTSPSKFTHLAAGGRVSGPGSGTSDTAGLFALSNGEHVTKASSAAKYGPRAMAAVNSGRAVIGFANGGQVGKMAAGGAVNVTTSTPSAGSISSAMLAVVTKLANSSSALSAFTSSFVGGNVSGGVSRWLSVVLAALALNGEPSSLAAQVLRQISSESGGNPDAINLTDSNAAMGDPSRGLLQTIGSTFAAYHIPGTSSNIFDPLANVAAAINYARHVYGPSLMSGGMGLGSGHGYAFGGRTTKGFALVGEHGPEIVGFGGNEYVTPNSRLGGKGAGGNVYQVTVNVKGALSTDRDISRAVADGLAAHQRHGGNVPWK